MQPLVAPGVIRFSLIHDIQGEHAVNVLDIHSSDDSSGGVWPRERQGEEVSATLLNAWAQHVQPQLHSSAKFMRVDWVDLDSATGPTGSRTSTDTYTLPAAGSSTSGDPMPSLTSMLIRKAGSAGRGLRQGRLFLAGLGEGQAKGNQWETAALGAITTAMDNFLPAITEEAILDSHTYWPVVVHTKLGAYVSQSKITNMSPDPYVSSQVRRKPGR